MQILYYKLLLEYYSATTILDLSVVNSIFSLFYIQIFEQLNVVMLNDSERNNVIDAKF